MEKIIYYIISVLTILLIISFTLGYYEGYYEGVDDMGNEVLKRLNSICDQLGNRTVIPMTTDQELKDTFKEL